MKVVKICLIHFGRLNAEEWAGVQILALVGVVDLHLVAVVDLALAWDAECGATEDFGEVASQ